MTKLGSNMNTTASFTSNKTRTSSNTRIAFVQSCWHDDIVNQLRDSFSQEIGEIFQADIEYFEVPGAFEIPLHTKLLAESGNFHAVVAAGLVVDGGIYRHEFVASAVIDGLMRVQLDSKVPVFSAVLTPQDFLSDGQPEFFKQHFVTKGKEAAQACATTLEKLSVIEATRAA